MEFDPETYDQRIGALLEFIKKQNIQQQKEDAWVESQNQKFKLKSNKPKRKTKAQVRKEQLIKLKTQVPKMGNVSKFFNF